MAGTSTKMDSKRPEKMIVEITDCEASDIFFRNGNTYELFQNYKKEKALSETEKSENLGKRTKQKRSRNYSLSSADEGHSHKKQKTKSGSVSSRQKDHFQYERDYKLKAYFRKIFTSYKRKRSRSRSSKDNKQSSLEENYAEKRFKAELKKSSRKKSNQNRNHRIPTIPRNNVLESSTQRTVRSPPNTHSQISLPSEMFNSEATPEYEYRTVIYILFFY